MIGARLFGWSRCLALVVVVAAVLAALVPVPEARAAGSSVTNSVVDDLAVFSQDYTGMSAVPGNMCVAMDTMAGTTRNLTLSYSGANHCVSLDAMASPTGKLFVAGLSPSLLTTITLDMGMSRTDEDAVVNAYVGGAWLAIRILDGTPSDDLQITSYYYTYSNPTRHSATSVTENMGFNNSGRFEIKVVSNTADKTNQVYLNGVKKLTTPYTRFRAVNLITAYDMFVNPFVYFDFASVYSGQTARLQLYSIEQTVPRYSYVTPISDPGVISFGVDGPHAWSTVDDGLALLDGATIWADVTAVDDYSAPQMAALKGLIAEGFELGIHYSARLKDMSMASAIALMDEETAEITGIFGQAPTSWCSLQGADNVTHAEYAYTELGMVSRNGANGSAAGLASIGNLCDDCWTFWNTASAAGLVVPSFSHQLDVTPAIDWSISATHFQTLVSNYESRGIRVIGFREYWDKAQNSYHTRISDVVSDPGVSIRFTVDNQAGRSRLLVNAPWASTVQDGSGGIVPFEAYGPGIVIEVEDGDYTVAGPTPAPGLVYPANGKVTRDSTPWLDWSDVSCAAPVHYRLQVDDDAEFSSPVVNKSGLTLSSRTISPALADGTYYWRVKAVDGVGNAGPWSAAWSFMVDTEPPPAPVHSDHINYPLTTTDTTPWLDWHDVTDISGVSYGLQVDNNADFSSPVLNKGRLTRSSCTVSPALADGWYYWRVRAVDGAGNASAWTAAWPIIVDTVAPSVPDLLYPADGTVTTDVTPWLDWSDAIDATTWVVYRLQVDNDADFSSPEVNKFGWSRSSQTLNTLPAGTYYWRVAAVDGTNNQSAWMAVWSFTIL